MKIMTKEILKQEANNDDDEIELPIYNVIKKYNLEIIVPDRDELFIDFDGTDSIKRFDKALNILKETSNYQPEVVLKYASKSGAPNMHIIVGLNEYISHKKRIALQACLGSDNVREMLSFMRYNAGIKYPVLLFVPEKAMEKVTEYINKKEEK